VIFVGSFGPSLLLIGLSFLDCTQTALAVTLLTIAVSVSGCVFCGYFVNHMDIAPQYAGTLMGISNGIAASSGFIAPYVASVLTTDVSLSRDFSKHDCLITSCKDTLLVDDVPLGLWVAL